MTFYNQIKQFHFFSLPVEHIFYVIDKYHITIKNLSDEETSIEIILRFITELSDRHNPLFYLMKLYGTYAWNYVDVFIMMVSIGLANLFKQLNNEIKIKIERANFEVIDCHLEINSNFQIIIHIRLEFVLRIFDEYSNEIYGDL